MSCPHLGSGELVICHDTPVGSSQPISETTLAHKSFPIGLPRLAKCGSAQLQTAFGVGHLARTPATQRWSPWPIARPPLPFRDP